MWPQQHAKQLKINNGWSIKPFNVFHVFGHMFKSPILVANMTDWFADESENSWNPFSTALVNESSNFFLAAVNSWILQWVKTVPLNSVFSITFRRCGPSLGNENYKIDFFCCTFLHCSQFFIYHQSSIWELRGPGGSMS